MATTYPKYRKRYKQRRKVVTVRKTEGILNVVIPPRDRARCPEIPGIAEAFKTTVYNPHKTRGRD